MADGVVRRMLGYGDKIMACEMIFPKGAYVEPHCHSNHQQMVYVLRVSLSCSAGKKNGLCFQVISVTAVTTKSMQPVLWKTAPPYLTCIHPCVRILLTTAMQLKRLNRRTRNGYPGYPDYWRNRGDSHSTQKLNIGISNGILCELLNPSITPKAQTIIDASGKFIIPGCIDEHIHFNDPGTTHREDFPHGTAACAVGGITTAIAMPTNTPLVLNKTNLQLTLDTYEGNGYVDYAVHGGLDASNDGQLEEFWLNTGITAVKVFTCYSSPDMGWVRDGILYKNMKLLADHNATMIIHSENHDLIALAEKELRDRGRCDGMAHCQSHPVLSEVEAIRRIIYYVEDTGITTVIPHVSTWEGLESIKKARDRGLPVFAETCAQYLTFTETDVQEQGPYLKFTPPVHSKENRAHILEQLKKGM